MRSWRALLIAIVVGTSALGCATEISKQGLKTTIGPASISGDGTTVESTITENFWIFASDMVEVGVGILRFVLPGGLGGGLPQAAPDHTHAVPVSSPAIVPAGPWRPAEPAT